MIAGLPPSIAKRELEIIARKLEWGEDSLRIMQLDDSVGPGNILSIEILSDQITEVFTGFGQRGTSAERVARSTVKHVQYYLSSGVPVWQHLADQLLLPMAMASGGEFSTCSLTSHAETNASVIEQFMEIKIHCEEIGRGLNVVRVHS